MIVHIMTNYYITRHGQDDDNARGLLNGRTDSSLTALGVQQAYSLANKIKEIGIKFDGVYCSPLTRTLKTAIIISKVCGLKEPEVNSLLIERDFGFMTHKNTSDIEKLCTPHILKTKTCTYFLKVDGAESFPELIVRAKEFWNLIKPKHASGNILLITHGDIGKMLYAAYHDLDWKRVLKLFHFGNTELVFLSRGLTGERSKIIEAPQYNL